jgi:A/G-specific adenine glycosylase
MSQQTQVSRILAHYNKFLRRFPSLQVLVQAQQRDVVVAWKGLGYNNRAVRLHRFAQAVCSLHEGKIPDDYDALVALPGIGRYTANALLSSAYGKHVPVVDVNVRRFLSRIFWTMHSTGELRSEKEIWQLAATLLPGGKAYTWNQALMDVGATICTAQRPRCTECPAGALCRSRAFMKRSSSPHPKHEPSLDGLPNRIYRGRIVDVLRHRTRVHAHELGKTIYERYSRRNEQWLHGLLAGLQRDGLISIRRNGSRANSVVTLV